jgi:U4/U6.U5 tri-snRNP component SNU23
VKSDQSDKNSNHAIIPYHTMSTNLNYKQVANVTRRTWDVETYEKKAKARKEATEDDDKNKEIVGDDSKEEFRAAPAGAAGPQGSKRAFLQARRGKIDDIDSKVGTTEIVSEEVAATVTVPKDGVVKTGVGWQCKVCDCFLKDSLTYLDHINGRRHQKKLGFTMRVERSTKDQLKAKLSQLARNREEEEKRSQFDETAEDFHDIVKAKDEEARQKKEERRRKRQERKKRAGVVQEEKEVEEQDEEEVVEAAIDPSMAAMMGFSGFGGGNKC